MYRRDWDYQGWKKYKWGINESTLQNLMTSDAGQMRKCTLHKALKLRIASDTKKDSLPLALKQEVVRYDIT